MMQGSFGAFGTTGSLGIWPFDSGSDTAPASSGTTPIADFYEPSNSAWAYRAFSQSGSADLIFQVIRAPAGNTIGKNVYRSSGGAWTAINAAYAQAASRGGLKKAYSIASGTSTSGSSGSSSQPSQSQIDAVTAGLNGRVTSTGNARGGKPNGANAPGGQGNSPLDWLNAVSGLLNAATPAVTGIVTAAQGGGLGGSPAQIAAQIAAKQRKLAETTDPVKRARLTAEIAQLKKQQAMYAGAVSDVSGGTSVGDLGGGGDTQAGATWVWPVVIIGGLLVVGSLVMSKKRGAGSSRSTALALA